MKFTPPPRTRFILFMLSAVTLFSLALTQQPSSAQDVPYYYYLGQQTPLDVSETWVAVGLSTDTAAARADALAAASAFDSAVAPQIIEVGNGADFALLPIAAGAAPDQALDTAAQVAAQAGSGFTWVNPVFDFGSTRAILTDELIAAFPAAMTDAQIDTYLAQQGLARISELLGNENVFQVRVLPGSGKNALGAANAVHTGGVALYAEPNFALLMPRPNQQPAAQVGPQLVPSDTLYAQQWHLNNTAQYSGAQAGADINAPEAWDLTTGDTDIIIAVLDDGVELAHPDLNDKIVAPYDAAMNDNDPTPLDTAFQREHDAHGTNAAGLAVAEGNNEGVSGVCRTCRLMPIRIAYSQNANGDWYTTNTIIANGINHARTNGAAVLSNSWGGGAPSTAVTNAFTQAATTGRGGLGAVVVIAAGNSFGQSVIYPANLSDDVAGVIAVGATNWCDGRKAPNNNTNGCDPETWWGNNHGTEVNVSAPGHHLFSTDLTGVNGYDTDSGAAGDYFARMNGTSGATPITAGVAGLMLSANDTLSAATIREMLQITAQDIHTPGYDTSSGWGRINAVAAVQQAILGTVPVVNDDFAAPVLISAIPFSFNQNTAGATNDTTDPQPACETNEGKSVWFRLTPTVSALYRLTTALSSYDTVLSIWTGTEGSLTAVGCNDDASAGAVTSQLDLELTAGTTYQIMVSGAGNTGGSLAFAAQILSGDDFDYPFTISSLPYSLNLSTVYATNAADDPAFCVPVGKTLWLRYTPTNSANVEISTEGSTFDTVAAVFTGTRGSLTRIGCDDDGGAGTTSLLNLNMVAGTTYHIALAGYDGASGNLALSITGEAAPVLVITEPTGTITTAYGNPTYRWPDTGASTYEVTVWLLEPSVPTLLTPYSSMFYYNSVPDSFCTGGVCSLEATTQPSANEAARLVNGTYAAYVRVQDGEWSDPTNFTLDAPDLAPITTGTHTNLNTPRPTLNWTLGSGATHTTWFNLYIVPKVQFDGGDYTPTYYQWHSRAERCGGVTGTTCSFAVPVDLADNTAYYFYVQSYGPSGYSTGGPYSNGWGGGEFTVDYPSPALPTNLSHNINNGQVTLSWGTDAVSTSHFVAVYSWTANAWEYADEHSKSGDPALTCSGGTCTLLTDQLMLENGSYSFYVNGIGNGQTSTGGPFVNGFAGPTDSANTSEAGDIVLNFPAPVVTNITALNVSLSGTTATISFTGDPHATWYQVWLGTSGAAETYYFAWHSALSLTCHLDQSCTGSITLPAAIASGSEYYLAVQGVGPGGSSTGGPVSNGFAVSDAFTAP
ncbi:MAG: S8 family serine peptidase [bacterium]|nr:S8 family serine peptidase [bacterium]